MSFVLERFLREAKLASQLDHPYAAHIYASGAERDDGLLWIAMEFVRGISFGAERDELAARGEPVADPRQGWRVLRAEIWRQFGVLLDLEKKYELGRVELLDCGDPRPGFLAASTKSHAGCALATQHD